MSWAYDAPSAVQTRTGLSRVSRVGTWRATELTAKFSGKICVVVKAAGVGNIAERLTCVHQRAAFDQIAPHDQDGAKICGDCMSTRGP